MENYRIVLADDHAMFRQGIKRILDEIDGLVVVGEAGDGLALLKLLRKIPADMVILDISMPGKNGLEVLKRIKLVRPGLPVLIFSMFAEDEFAMPALHAGASGYLRT